MARKYKYTDYRTGRLIFETIQPNYISDVDVDKMVFEHTGRDPRLERAIIEREIRMVKD